MTNIGDTLPQHGATAVSGPHHAMCMTHHNGQAAPINVLSFEAKTTTTSPFKKQLVLRDYVSDQSEVSQTAKKEKTLSEKLFVRLNKDRSKLLPPLTRVSGKTCGPMVVVVGRGETVRGVHMVDLTYLEWPPDWELLEKHVLNSKVTLEVTCDMVQCDTCGV